MQSAFKRRSNRRYLCIRYSGSKDLSRKSKTNSGQVKICREAICQLRNGLDNKKQSMVVQTPHTRQRELLERALAEENVSSIDGFQGQEADIVIYVTVRCNLYREVGFLKDMRRLNVALTRARAGIIIIGDADTLTGKGITGLQSRSTPLDLEKAYRSFSQASTCY